MHKQDGAVRERVYERMFYENGIVKKDNPNKAYVPGQEEPIDDDRAEAPVGFKSIGFSCVDSINRPFRFDVKRVSLIMSNNRKK